MERKTQQRTAIRQAFEAAGRPLSPQEVLGAARSAIPKLGIATVYRNIKGLVENGWLQTVSLPGAPDRYELVCKRHHHHFYCRKCDGVYDIEDCPSGIQEISPVGFEVESHEIILYGLCVDCARS